MKRTKTERYALTKRYVDKQERLYKAAHQHVWDSGYVIEPYHRGQWANHSWCNTGGCECCKNPRRVKWYPERLRVSLSENRNRDSFNDQLEEYYFGGCY